MNQGQTSLDYLNEISPEQQKPAGFKLSFKIVILVGIVAIILVLIAVAIAGSIGSSAKKPWQQLPARLAVTTTVVNNSAKRIKNSQLRSLNSNLKLYLTNTTRDLAVPLGKVGVNAAKLPESILTQENSTGITERLENARLNAKFDSTYAREMNFQLATLLSLYQELYSKSKSTETKTFLKSAYDNLLPTQQALQTFSASNE